MAAAALRPQVMDFVDGILTGADRELYMEEFLIDPAACPCVGQTLRQARLRSQYQQLEKLDVILKKLPLMKRFAWNLAVVATK